MDLWIKFIKKDISLASDPRPMKNNGSGPKLKKPNPESRPDYLLIYNFTLGILYNLFFYNLHLYP